MGSTGSKKTKSKSKPSPPKPDESTSSESKLSESKQSFHLICTPIRLADDHFVIRVQRINSTIEAAALHVVGGDLFKPEETTSKPDPVEWDGSTSSRRLVNVKGNQYMETTTASVKYFEGFETKNHEEAIAYFSKLLEKSHILNTSYINNESKEAWMLSVRSLMSSTLVANIEIVELTVKKFFVGPAPESPAEDQKHYAYSFVVHLTNKSAQDLEDEAVRAMFEQRTVEKLLIKDNEKGATAEPASTVEQSDASPTDTLDVGGSTPDPDDRLSRSMKTLSELRGDYTAADTANRGRCYTASRMYAASSDESSVKDESTVDLLSRANEMDDCPLEQQENKDEEEDVNTTFGSSGSVFIKEDIEDHQDMETKGSKVNHNEDLEKKTTDEADLTKQIEGAQSTKENEEDSSAKKNEVDDNDELFAQIGGYRDRALSTGTVIDSEDSGNSARDALLALEHEIRNKEAVVKEGDHRFVAFNDSELVDSGDTHEGDMEEWLSRVRGSRGSFSFVDREERPRSQLSDPYRYFGPLREESSRNTKDSSPIVETPKRRAKEAPSPLKFHEEETTGEDEETMTTGDHLTAEKSTVEDVATGDVKDEKMEEMEKPPTTEELLAKLKNFAAEEKDEMEALTKQLEVVAIPFIHENDALDAKDKDGVVQEDEQQEDQPPAGSDEETLLSRTADFDEATITTIMSTTSMALDRVEPRELAALPAESDSGELILTPGAFQQGTDSAAVQTQSWESVQSAGLPLTHKKEEDKSSEDLGTGPRPRSDTFGALSKFKYEEEEEKSEKPSEMQTFFADVNTIESVGVPVDKEKAAKVHKKVEFLDTLLSAADTIAEALLERGPEAKQHLIFPDDDREYAHASPDLPVLPAYPTAADLQELLEGAYPNGMTRERIASVFGCSVELVDRLLAQLIASGIIMKIGEEWLRVDASADTTIATSDPAPPVPPVRAESLLERPLLEHAQSIDEAMATSPTPIPAPRLRRWSTLPEEELPPMAEPEPVEEKPKPRHRRRPSSAFCFGPIGSSNDKPTIAIITLTFAEMQAVDALLEGAVSKEHTHRIGGDSAVFKLGKIGSKSVVTTKLSVIGDSRDAMISAGSSVTRMFGNFTSVEHVLLVGVGVSTFPTISVGDLVVGTDYIYAFGSQRDEAGALLDFNVRLHAPLNNAIANKGVAIKSALSALLFGSGNDSTRINVHFGSVGAIGDLESEGFEEEEEILGMFGDKYAPLALASGFDSVIAAIKGSCIDSWALVRVITDMAIDGKRTISKEAEAAACARAAAAARLLIEKME